MVEHLIVGLGNPGEEYAFTPHNLGFLVIDRLASEHQIRVTRKENMSRVGLGVLAGKQVALAKPQTYMNLSGGAVKGLLDRYQLTPADLLVIYDELDLPWGTLRIRAKGSAAGHKGMQNVVGSLGTDRVPRIRIGVDPGRESRDGARFVLTPFKRGQRQDVEEVVALCAEAAESILAEGVEKAMTKYNRRAQGLQAEEE